MSIALLTAIFALLIGIGVLWAQPKRLPNQVFFGSAVILFFGLSAIHCAVVAGQSFRSGGSGNPVPWLRINSAVGSFFPWTLWLLKESLRRADEAAARIFLRSWPWFALGILLATISFTEYYIPSDSLPTNHKRGVGYSAGVCVLAAAYATLTWQIRTEYLRQSGIRRLQLQFLGFNFSTAAFFYVTFAAVGNWLLIPALKQFALFVLLLAYVMTAWATTFYRVFDARQILHLLAQRLAVGVIVGLATYTTWHVLKIFIAPPADLLLSFIFCCSLAPWLDRKSRKLLDLDGEHITSAHRGDVISLARTEPSLDRLVSDFRTLLCRKYDVSFAALLFRREKTYYSDAFQIDIGTPVITGLRDMGWITPESLERRRATPTTDELRHLFEAKQLGLLLCAPRGSPTPSLLVAIGMKCNRAPITYPEILRIQNIAELMDNVLTHSRLTAQTALKAKAEHLAMMSRGLAHDLKNLITPISSYLVHSEPKVAAGTVEEEVHAAAKRSVRIMNDYVREALFFANRLEPRFETVSTGKIFDTVRELAATRANWRQVKLVVAVESDHTLTADAVLLQRMLGNLVFNAIDASAPGKIVTLSATQNNARGLRLSVVDQGSGIAPQHLSRIFEPYFTTKEFGEDIRGFGLGLTISQKIVHLHHGTISVQSQLGYGTAVVVDLPLKQPLPDRMTEHSVATSPPVTVASPASR